MPPAPSSVRPPARLRPGQGHSSIILPPQPMLPASLAGAQLEHARSAPEQAAGARIGVRLSADAAQRLAAQPQRGAVLVVGGQADLVAHFFDPGVFIGLGLFFVFLFATRNDTTPLNRSRSLAANWHLWNATIIYTVGRFRGRLGQPLVPVQRLP